MIRLCFVVSLLCLLPGAGHGQSIRGTVHDEVAGQPVAGAAVFLTDLQGAILAVARSGPDGAFVLQSTADDTVRVRAERFGYQSLETQPWVLRHASVLELAIRLSPAPVALDTLTITGAWRSKNRAGFEERRRSDPMGRFADAAKLARIRSPRAIDRLRPLIPGMVVDQTTGVIKVRKRGVDLTGVATCQPRFYIDGTRFPGDISLDILVEGRAMRAVEFYNDPMHAPARFSLGADMMMLARTGPNGAVISGPGLAPPCAIIVIWTDVGFGDVGELADRAP